jgi:hypothetical protein
MFQGTAMLYLVNHPVVFFFVSFILLWVGAQVNMLIRKKRHPRPLEDQDDFSLILGATLTLLGLLVGFTFSMAAGRYDQRKNYEDEEANAIGTEYVRADLLPLAEGDKVRALLREYLRERIVFYTERSRESLHDSDVATAELQNRLWAAIVSAVNTEPTQPHALVATGMNDVLNRQGYTQAAWLNRVPLAAWILMMAIALFSNILLGYRSHGRAPVMFLVLPIALSISFFLISDIDSPRGGVILVQPQNLNILANALK